MHFCGDNLMAFSNINRLIILIGFLFIFIGISALIISKVKNSNTNYVNKTNTETFNSDFSGFILIGPIPIKIDKKGIAIDRRVIPYSFILFVLLFLLYFVYIFLISFY